MCERKKEMNDGMEWEFGVSRCKLLYIRMDNSVLL